MYAARSLTISLLSHRDDTDKTPSKHSVGRGFCKHRLHSATISSMWIYRKSSSGYLRLQHKGWNVPFCSMEHAGEVPFHLRCLGRVPHFEGSWFLVMILENWKKTKQFETNKQQKTYKHIQPLGFFRFMWHVEIFWDNEFSLEDTSSLLDEMELDFPGLGEFHWSNLCRIFFHASNLNVFFICFECLFEDISIDIHFFICVYNIYRKYTDLNSFWFYQRIDSQRFVNLWYIDTIHSPPRTYSHGGVKLTEETEELRGDPAPVSQQLVGSLLQRLPQAMPAMVESSDLKSAL